MIFGVQLLSQIYDIQVNYQISEATSSLERKDEGDQ